MSDKSVAAIGRNLAFHLRRYAHDREDSDAKTIAMLHTDLCKEVRTEEAEARQLQQQQQQENPDGQKPPDG